jgi:hypothetical protein
MVSNWMIPKIIIPILLPESSLRSRWISKIIVVGL